MVTDVTENYKDYLCKKTRNGQPGDPLIMPEDGKRINNKAINSKYCVNINVKEDELNISFYEFAECYFKAAHIISEYVIYRNRSLSVRDSYIYPIVYMYRHSLELGLKSIIYKFERDNEARKNIIKECGHSLKKLLIEVKQGLNEVCESKECKWITEFINNYEEVDQNSTAFRYPFDIKSHKEDNYALVYEIYSSFKQEIVLDVLLVANKFEAAYEIVTNWNNDRLGVSVEWENLSPIFIEKGEDFYLQSVVGYCFAPNDYYLYVKSYKETADYIKQFVERKADAGEYSLYSDLFFSMCYLYRNAVELYLKSIWMDDVEEAFLKKCELMGKGKKHSVDKIWNKVRNFALSNVQDDNNRNKECAFFDRLNKYCGQLQTLDNRSQKFRYPVGRDLEVNYNENEYYDFFMVGDFLEELCNGLDCTHMELNRRKETS